MNDEEHLKLAKKKKKIEQAEQRIQKEKNLIKQRAKKIETKRLIENGKLIDQAGIQELSPDCLLGALLEIKEKITEERKQYWIQKAQDQLKEIPIPCRCIVSLEKNTDKAKTLLKELNFKWNSFNREWQGYVQKESIPEIKKIPDAKIVILD